MKLVYQWLKRRFLRHEVWALRRSVEWPILSIFFLGSLNLWWIGPGFLVSAVFILLFVTGHAVTAVIIGAFGTMIAMPAFVRFFQWHFMAVGLMIGSGTLAHRRLAELESSEWLTGNVDQTSREANVSEKPKYFSKLWAVLDRGKVWFFVYWALFTAIIFYGNGHSLSEFLVLIPYALIGGLLAAVCVMRLYTKGHFEEDDHLRRD